MAIKHITALFLATALLALQNGGVGAQDKVVFTTSSTSMLNIPVYVADVMGDFAEQKIVPEFVVLKSGGATAMAAVLGGNADIYIGAPSTALGAANRGGDVVVFGAILTEFALDIVIQKEVATAKGLTAASTIAERFAALNGLKLGVTGAGSATHQIAQYVLRTAKLDPERDATLVFVSSSEDMQAAFVSKRVDGIVTANPSSEMLVRDGSFLLVNGAAGNYPALKGLAHIVLVGSKRWVAADPNRTTRVLRAIESAQRALRDPQQNVTARDRVHAKYFPGFDKAVFDAAWENTRQAIPATTRLADDAIARNMAFVKEFSDQKFKIAAEAVYTNAYAPN